MKLLLILFNKLSAHKDMTIDFRHVDVVDGVRGISVLLVLWFHFWQQTWLMPNYRLPGKGIFGIRDITPVHIRWVGYLFVDMMVLVSSFCLFLPVARSMILDEPSEKPLWFYKKRFARIYPCYAFFVLVSFVFNIIEGAYPDSALAARDLISHLTFTNLFRIDTYVFSKINVALWTVSLEACFYILFPMLAVCFKKRPVISYAVLMGLGIGYIYGFGISANPVSMAVNQFPAFLPVFANGFLIAYAFTYYSSKCTCKRFLSLPFTAIAIFAGILIWKLIVSCYSYTQDKQIWQLQNRIRLSFAFSLFLISAACAAKPFRILFSNRLARYLGSVSFNLYMCHQRIMVRLSRGMGFASGADVSAAGSKVQWLLTSEALLISLAVATIITYCLEVPVRNRIMNYWRKEEISV